MSRGRRDIFLTDSLIGGQRDGKGVVIGGDGGHFLLVTVNTFLGRKSIRKLDPVGSTVRYEMMKLCTGSV